MIRVFSHWFRLDTLLRVVSDLMLVSLLTVLAVAWLNRGHLPALEAAAPYALLFAVTMIALDTALGFYQRSTERAVVHGVLRVVVSFLLAVPVAYGVFGVLPGQVIETEVLALAALPILIVMVGLRGYSARSVFGPMLIRRVMVLGTGSEAAAVEQSLVSQGAGIQVVGFYPVQSNEATQVPQHRVFPDVLSLADTARMHKADEIIVAVCDRRGGMPLGELLDCKLGGVRVLDLSTCFERVLGQVRLDSLRASWLIFGEGFRQGLVRTVVKRAFDISAASILLLATLPVMLLTAFLIVLETGFPIFYRQERVGQGGRLFKVIKFRSMRTDAERDGKPRWAASNDDRVTRVGRAIRKTRIDELPQLFNVLKGDLSLVGPRPERAYFVDQLTRKIPFYAARHTVKPGLTGWAQVRYRYGASVDDAAQKLQYDLYYVKNHTLFLDLVILVETVGVVLTGSGAQ